MDRKLVEQINNPANELVERNTNNRQITWKEYIGILLIGILNNIPFWVANSSAQNIVEHFEAYGMLGAITWASVLLGMGASSINAILTSKNVSYRYRAIANSLFMIFGLFGAAFAPNIYLAILCIIFIGISADFGESMMLGYLASRTNKDKSEQGSTKNPLIHIWGIATGLSGLLGSSFSFLSQILKSPYYIIFLSISPIGIVYCLCFICLVDSSNTSQNTPSQENDINLGEIELKSDTIEEINESDSSTNIKPNHDDDEVLAQDTELNIIHTLQTDEDNLRIDVDDTIVSDEENLSFCSLDLWKSAFYFSMTNGSLYFLQYVIITCFSDCSMTEQEKKTMPYLYALSTLIFKIGNLIGRSSLKFIKVKKVAYLLAFQFFLFFIWLLNVLFKFMKPVIRLIILAILGINSGVAYINVCDQLMNYPNVSQRKREMITNITSISISSFIALSSIFTLIAQNTFFKTECRM